MTRFHGLRRGSLVSLLLAATVVADASTPVMTSQEVLKRIEGISAVNVGAPESAAAVVVRDLDKYRSEAATLSAPVAASRWFELYDRVVSLGNLSTTSDLGVFDRQTMRPVSRNSLLMSLPPPPAWPAFRKEAARRVSDDASRDNLALRFLGEILEGDRKAADATVTAIDISMATRPAEEREPVDVALRSARSLLVRMYGTAQEVGAEFEHEVSGDESYRPDIDIPDLVGLIGQDEARRLITAAITGSTQVRPPNGDATRKLAREIALANVGSMRVPQWGLATDIDSKELYEAIEKKFDPGAAGTAGYEIPQGDYFKREAAAWYFLRAVIDGRQSDAERALIQLSGGRDDIYLPREAVEALRKAGREKELYQFLAAQLERRPELRAWDIYVREAAFAGHSQDAIVLIDKLIARKSLPDFLVADLRVRRIGALLGADRVAEASKAYRALFEKSPVRGEATLRTRYVAALAAAAVGRLTNDRVLNSRSLDFAIAAWPLLGNKDSNPYMRDTPSDLWRELRDSGRAGDVQVLAIAELNRTGERTGFNALTNGAGGPDVAALVELAGIWSEANRHAELLQLLAESTRWGVADAGALLSVTDSRRMPFGVMIARALRATSDNAGALRVARATVSQLPGNDSAYEILAALDANPLTTLDALFALDQYEERPLIWKARVQLDAGALADAETTIRRAIAIDPSDGEQGPNDRMRAYAVLSGLLAKKGDTQGAGTYAGAVRAIRMSEHADLLHAAGLYERAFKEYRAALEQFSDAYCIQSRLAVQLQQQGRHAEALEHYRRAYELMPDSFGRVESHCFGCESVFQGEEAQSIAERVFEDVARKSPAKPQAFYLLAYLREQQGRPVDALAPLRKSVSMDPQYLNAWSHLAKLREHVYIEPWEIDIAKLKLLELDPMGRHVQYTVEDVGDLGALWRTAERALATVTAARPIREKVFALRASAEARLKLRAGLQPDMLEQMNFYESMVENQFGRGGVMTGASAAAVLGNQQLVRSTLQIIAGEGQPGEM